MRLRFGIPLVGIFLLLLGGCAREPESAEVERVEEVPEPPPAEVAPAEEPPAEEAPPAQEAKKEPATKPLTNPAAFTEQAPESYVARFDTSKGVFRVEVTRSASPRGADRFYNLVKNGFYDECRFFRIVPNFVVQFGLNGDPKVNAVWREARIKDDPVSRTNRKGAVTFATAGANTRTTQVFINLKANPSLDSQGFSPFGQVIEGMEVVESLYAGHGGDPDQGMITNQGNAYLNKRYPDLDYIKTATIE